MSFYRGEFKGDVVFTLSAHIDNTMTEQPNMDAYEEMKRQVDVLRLFLQKAGFVFNIKEERIKIITEQEWYEI